MWFISKYGFLSVVEHRDKSGSMIVRARAKADLEQLCQLANHVGIPNFEQGQIEENPDADYHYRLTAPVDSWKQVTSAVAERIDYDNFKNAVAKDDPERAVIYGQVWADLMKIQFPDSGSWVDRTEVDRNENVSRLYRMAAEHLLSCLDQYTGETPIPEDALGSAFDPPALPEAFDNDPISMLEYRMIQRIGMGFWQQAEGYGFDRLRAAISSAERAASLRLADSDWVPMTDEERQRESTTLSPPPLIQNASLLLEQVPDYYAPGLDPVGFNCGVVDPNAGANTKEWLEIWTFALTFNGYQLFGGDNGARERLEYFVASVEESFLENGQLPSLDLALLRACLFFQQRHWLKWAGVMTRSCPPETAKFLDALLRGIKSHL